MKKAAMLCAVFFVLTQCSILPLAAQDAAAKDSDASTIEALKARLDGLEKRVEAEDQQIRKISDVSTSVGEMMKSQEGAKTSQGSIGGYAKFYLFDKTVQDHKGKTESTNSSAGLSDFLLFYTRELADWLSVDVETQFTIKAAATPKLSSVLTRTAAATLETKIHQANVTVRLPHDVEMKLGSFLPLYSESYARGLWWNEQYHENNGLCLIEQWYDAGVEVYHNFELGDISLPTYLYVTNGASNGPPPPATGYSPQLADNNENKSLMVHVAPEMLGGKLRLPLSASAGKYDDANKFEVQKHNAGFDLLLGKWNFGGEYMYQWYEKVLPASTDGTKTAYFAKATYRINPTWRVATKFSHSEMYKPGSTTKQDIYNQMTVALNYFLTKTTVMMLQYMRDDQEISDGSDKLNADRLTLGMRTTFTVF
ncbi:MAG: porin [Endomicrobiales bacterium]